METRKNGSLVTGKLSARGTRRRQVTAGWNPDLVWFQQSEGRALVLVISDKSNLKNIRH
jgi:hypothetical protein